jgi:hypothetical protein
VLPDLHSHQNADVGSEEGGNENHGTAHHNAERHPATPLPTPPSLHARRHCGSKHVSQKMHARIGDLFEGDETALKPREQLSRQIGLHLHRLDTVEERKECGLI